MRLVQRLYTARQVYLPGVLFVSIGLMTCGAAVGVVLFIASHEYHRSVPVSDGEGRGAAGDYVLCGGCEPACP